MKQYNAKTQKTLGQISKQDKDRALVIEKLQDKEVIRARRLLEKAITPYEAFKNIQERIVKAYG